MICENNENNSPDVVYCPGNCNFYGETNSNGFPYYNRDYVAFFECEKSKVKFVVYNTDSWEKIGTYEPKFVSSDKIYYLLSERKVPIDIKEYKNYILGVRITSEFSSEILSEFGSEIPSKLQLGPPLKLPLIPELYFRQYQPSFHQIYSISGDQLILTDKVLGACVPYDWIPVLIEENAIMWLKKKKNL